MNLYNITNYIDNIDISILDNEIWKFLISAFAAHGFLDFITLLPQIINNLSVYLVIVLLFLTISTYIPSLALMIFVGSSMYHFGEDFRYLFNFQNRGTRWGGSILFGASTIKGYNIWSDTLKWMGVSNPFIFILCVFLSSIPSLLHIYYNPLAIILPTAIGICGPYPFLLIYACLIHTPLAVYRYVLSFDTKLWKTLCLVIWLGGSILVYTILPYLIPFISVNVIRFMFGIVVAHIVYITQWQLRQKLIDLIISSLENYHNRNSNNNNDDEII